MKIILFNNKKQDEEEDEAELKKSKYEDLTCGKPLTRTPLMTLVGHKEGVSGVTWMDQVFNGPY